MSTCEGLISPVGMWGCGAVGRGRFWTAETGGNLGEVKHLYRYGRLSTSCGCALDRGKKIEPEAQTCKPPSCVWTLEEEKKRTEAQTCKPPTYCLHVQLCATTWLALPLLELPCAVSCSTVSAVSRSSHPAVGGSTSDCCTFQEPLAHAFQALQC